jgi:hypothetical protein
MPAITMVGDLTAAVQGAIDGGMSDVDVADTRG